MGETAEPHSTREAGAEQQEPVVKLITMGSVREEPCKRGMPVDTAKVLAVAPQVAEIIAISGRNFDMGRQGAVQLVTGRLHLIGDVSKLAVEVAQAEGSTLRDPDRAIVKLSATLIDQKEHPSEAVLRPYTEEKIALTKILAEKLGQPNLKVESSVDYIRAHPGIANKMLMVIEGVYRFMDNPVVSVDIEAMRLALAGQSLPPQHNDIVRSVRGIVYRTLPSRLRRLLDRNTGQFQQTFYGVSEAALATALVETDEANIYASYRGSDISSCSLEEIKGSEGKIGTIIENMRLLVMMVLYETMMMVPLVKDKLFPLLESVNERFYIHNILDGIGLRSCQKGSAVQLIRCDPWTLDKRNRDDGNSADADDGGLVLPFQQKLPLIIVDEDGSLRPPRPEEINPILVRAAGGPEYIVLHNLPVLYAYLTAMVVDGRGGTIRRMDTERIQGILKANQIPSRTFEDWLKTVRAYLDNRLTSLRSEEEAGRGYSRSSSRGKLVKPLFPDNDHRVIGVLFCTLAADVLEEYERRKKNTSSSPSTVVAMGGGGVVLEQHELPSDSAAGAVVEDAVVVEGAGQPSVETQSAPVAAVADGGTERFGEFEIRTAGTESEAVAGPPAETATEAAEPLSESAAVDDD